MAPYERFEAWQLCHRLVLMVYRVTKTFPKDERFELTSQARRAAFSSAANIVEGSAKRGPREFRRYLDISIGSLGELGYIIRVSKDLDYVSGAILRELVELHRRSSQVTWALYASMGKR